VTCLTALLRTLPQDFLVHSLNVHRILLSSVMVAAKFLDDFYYSNEFWAKIGGVPNAELNTLELEFLFMTNFDLHVSRVVYDSYCQELVAWDQGLAMTPGYQSIMPRGLLSQVRWLASGGDEVLTPPEEEGRGGMEVDGEGEGLSSPPPGEDLGMVIE
jgi:hypothetical protein